MVNYWLYVKIYPVARAQAHMYACNMITEFVP